MSRVDGGGWLVAVQLKPGSSLHCDEHPSPSWRLPSSHSSFGNLRPSPHTAVQVPPVHLGSMVQVGEQPS